jgi:cellulose synthase/poly-beta-1,6-N-acetylglucosamine synthase-like glycosyltransferase
MSEYIALLIIILGGVNLVRIAIMLIATDIHEVKESFARQTSRKWSHDKTWVTVIVPAYNEELTIVASLESIFRNRYRYYDVIVVNDGSRDDTKRVVNEYIQKHAAHKRYRLKLINKRNGGKAHALNRAIAGARGSLVMCLDADSAIGVNAIRNAVRHFDRNDKLVGLSSNVQVVNARSLIGIAQKFEYLLSYRLKRALNVLNSEYIIGGVGSTFKKDFIKQINLYDSDTMTEDIDLTLKIISKGNKEYRLGFGYDVDTYTQGVQNYKDLIKQRYRWKFGRMQSLFKNRHLFFNGNRKYSKTLTFFQLPYAIVGELSLLVEPIFILFILYSSIALGSIFSIAWILGFMIFYMASVIMNDAAIPLKKRLFLVGQAPLVWLLFYVLTTVELCALVKSISNLKNIRKSMRGAAAGSWDHVARVSLTN